MNTRLASCTLVCLCFLHVANMRAQTAETPFPLSYYGPTPKSMEMIRHGHLSSNLNGGTMEFEVPIYTIEDRDFNIPITLQYSSGGFRPNQQTGEAGLGWSLLVGGAITREIVGLDDIDNVGGSTHFYRNEFATDTKIYTLPNTISITYDQFGKYPYASTVHCETTSDVYHFTMPGHSGNFVYQHDSTAFLAYGTSGGAGTYNIEYVTDSTPSHFVITTGDGYKYRFGYSLPYGQAVEQTFSRLPKSGGEQGSQLTSGDLTTVTWLLDQITAPNGRKVIFIYEGKNLSSTIPDPTDDVITTFCARETDVDGTKYYKEASITTTKYLKRIVVDSLSTAKTAVAFSWTRSSSKEINAGTLDKYSNLVTKTQKLTGIQVASGGQTIRNANMTYTEWGCRPLLSTVAIIGCGNYSFQYNTQNTIPPDITTNDVDFWGFYNGRIVPETSINPMGVTDGLSEYITSNFRNPDWTKSILGMLTRITYPTGGYTDIQYEANQAFFLVIRGTDSYGYEPANPYEEEMMPTGFLSKLTGYSNMFGSNTECGGVRVKSLTDTDLNGQSATRSFIYKKANGTCSGIAQQFPRYFVGKISGEPQYNTTVRFPASSFDTRHIAYSRVIEVLPDSSRVVSEFSDWFNCPDTFSNYYRQSYAGNVGTTTHEIIFWNNILREPDSNAYKRGLITKKTWTDKAGKSVKTESYAYSDYYNRSSTPLYSAYIVGSGDYWWSARREICDRRLYHKTTEYFPDSGLGTMTETTTYEYDLLGNQTRTTRSISSAGTEEERVSYSGTMENGEIYRDMIDSNMVSLPVERTVLRNGKVIKSNLMPYDRFNGQFLPAAEYKADLGEGVSSFTYYNGSTKDFHYGSAENTFDSYDARGNLTHSTNRTGLPSTIIYDTDGIHPMAVIYGSDNGQRQEYQTTTSNHFTNYEVNDVESYTVQFTTMVSGAFSFTFDGTVYYGSGGNTGIISAKLDGSNITVNSFTGPSSSSFSYYTLIHSPLPAGAHTLVITARGPGLTPSDPLFPGGTASPQAVNSWKMTGTLSVSYVEPSSSIVLTDYTTVYFNDFESSGTVNAGVNGSKGLTTSYNFNLSVDTPMGYILGYLQKDGTEWYPVYTRKTPNSNGKITATLPGSTDAPIDHLIVFPENSMAETYSWSPDGLLTSRTDGGGRTTWYEYDNYRRLSVILDTDHNPVTSYTYSIGNSLGDSYTTEDTYIESNQGEYIRTQSFYDGLGRPFETLLKGAWMVAPNAYADIATVQEYDSCGRLSKQWLPSGILSQTFTDKSTIKATAQSQYADTAPFSETKYYNNPLDKEKEMIGPGMAWRNASKKTSHAQFFNAFSDPDKTVRNYSLSFSGNTEAVIVKDAYPVDDAYLIDETIDEDGNRLLVFTNMFGEVVLERRFVEGEGNTQKHVDTYYCYDDAGRLTGVLPPMLLSFLEESNGGTFTASTTTEIGAYAYLYRYNSRGNLIAKKLPGAEWVYYIYDKGDRLVYSQDSNQRSNDKWSIHLTDRLGRPCLEGVIDAFLNPFSNTVSTKVIEVSRSYPSLSTSDLHYGYSVVGAPSSTLDILSVKWYGDYTFLGKWDIPSAAGTASATRFDESAPSAGYGSLQTTLENGQQTGSLEKVLGNTANNVYIWDVCYYDNKGRIVQQSRKNPNGEWARTNTAYNFTGRPTMTRTIYKDGINAMAERYSYTYDNWGRLLTVTHALSNRGSVPTGEFTYSVSKLLHDYEYDFAGRMVLDKRNGADALKTRFDYNVRSALTGIGAGWNATYQNYGDTFLEILTYHWGGNICSMDWMCGSDGVTRTYNCAYDGLSRLTGAAYSDNLSAPGTYSRGYTYDLHGNILSVATPTDTTAVSYTGNQRSGNFTYDANGNMTADPEAGLTGMTYNVLNLLSGYNAANNRQVLFKYSASGEKLSEQVKVSGLIESEKKYFGNLVYEGLALYPNRLLIDGGYVDITTTNNSSNYTYRYYVQDHLGNNRLVTDDSGTILQTNHYDPYGQLLSDISSSTPVSQHKYASKEWDTTTASYDFGARRYTPAIPRWTTIDPLAEKYYSVSPYVYCAGNPVNLVDPFGLWQIKQDGVLEAEKGDNAWTLSSYLNTSPEMAKKMLEEQGYVIDEKGLLNLKEGDCFLYDTINGAEGIGSLGVLGDVINSNLPDGISQVLFKNYWDGGGDLSLTSVQFAGILMYLKSSQTVKDIKATTLVGESGKEYDGFRAQADFYGSDYYALAFGRATVLLNTRRQIIGFNDEYNFDPKPYKARSIKNEIKTRAVRIASPKKAKSFIISYGYQQK